MWDVYKVSNTHDGYTQLAIVGGDEFKCIPKWTDADMKIYPPWVVGMDMEEAYRIHPHPPILPSLHFHINYLIEF